MAALAAKVTALLDAEEAASASAPAKDAAAAAAPAADTAEGQPAADGVDAPPVDATAMAASAQAAAAEGGKQETAAVADDDTVEQAFRWAESLGNLECRESQFHLCCWPEREHRRRVGLCIWDHVLVPKGTAIHLPSAASLSSFSKALSGPASKLRKIAFKFHSVSFIRCLNPIMDHTELCKWADTDREGIAATRHMYVLHMS